MMKDSRAPIIGTSLAILSAFLHSLDGLIGQFSKTKYSYNCSKNKDTLKANQVNRLSPMTAVEMAFWRCAGQCIWIWPVCYYRYVKNYKHSDLFYKPNYVFTYALITVTCVLTGFYSLTLLPIGDAVGAYFEIQTQSVTQTKEPPEFFFGTSISNIHIKHRLDMSSWLFLFERAHAHY